MARKSIKANEVFYYRQPRIKIQIYRDRLGASIGSNSTSADASGDEAIWPGRHDVADSSRATANKGTSAVDDHVRRKELGYVDGLLNAQLAM